LTVFQQFGYPDLPVFSSSTSFSFQSNSTQLKIAAAFAKSHPYRIPGLFDLDIGLLSPGIYVT
jgi:hypothetical protein